LVISAWLMKVNSSVNQPSWCPVVGLVAHRDVVALVDPHALADGDALVLEADLQLGRAVPPRQVHAEAVVVGAARRAIDEQLEDRLGHPDAAQPHAEPVVDRIGRSLPERLTARVVGSLATVRLVCRRRRRTLVVVERGTGHGRSLHKCSRNHELQDQANRKRN
jgi:hypothetical protein